MENRRRDLYAVDKAEARLKRKREKKRAKKPSV
jgi:hypothetical protein